MSYWLPQPEIYCWFFITSDNWSVIVYNSTTCSIALQTYRINDKLKN